MKYQEIPDVDFQMLTGELRSKFKSEWIAAVTGVSRSSLSRYATRRTIPSFDHSRRLWSLALVELDTNTLHKCLKNQ